jgi:hypothetical protein
MPQLKDIHIFPGICVIIASFPNTPKVHHRQVFHNVLSSIFGICRQNTKCPDFIKFIGQKPIPKHVMQSRKKLQGWCLPKFKKTQLVNIKSILQNTSSWGPIMWSLMYSLAAMCTPKNKGLFITFLQNIGKTLPCKKCAKDFTSLIRTVKINNIFVKVHPVQLVSNCNLKVQKKATKKNSVIITLALNSTFEHTVKTLEDAKKLLMNIPPVNIPPVKISPVKIHRSVRGWSVVNKHKKPRRGLKVPKQRKRGCGCG